MYTWNRVNYVGVVGSILALISIGLPWWMLSASKWWPGGTMTMYLYNTEIVGSSAFFGDWENDPISNVMALAVLVGLVIGSVLAIVGSLRHNKSLLISGGALGLAATLGFAITLQWLWLWTNGIGVYSSGILNGVSYSSHLESGFWLSAIGAVIMLVGGFAWKRFTSSNKPRIRPPVPPPP